MTDADLARIDTLLDAAREVEGCSDHGCLLRVHPRGGMGTNGGCHCVGRNSEDGWLRVRAERLDLVRLLTLARQTPALVAEVRRLRSWGSVSETLAKGQGEMLERNIARAEGFVRERDEARAEVERLREALAFERSESAWLRTKLPPITDADREDFARWVREMTGAP